MKGSSRRPEQMAETLRQVITDGLTRERVRQIEVDALRRLAARREMEAVFS